jgi:hypothetical protein
MNSFYHNDSEAKVGKIHWSEHATTDTPNKDHKSRDRWTQRYIGARVKITEGRLRLERA